MGRFVKSVVVIGGLLYAAAYLTPTPTPEELAKQQEECAAAGDDWDGKYCNRYDCDYVMSSYIASVQVSQGYEDKISQSRVDAQTGRRGDYNKMREENQWNRGMIDAGQRNRLEVAQKYLAHPKCTKDADFMRKMVQWSK
jgi:hypothetical protein